MSGERVERRLAAILAADVAGYSRLMGQDEAGTLARLKALRRELIDPAVAEHKGRNVTRTRPAVSLVFWPPVTSTKDLSSRRRLGFTRATARPPKGGSRLSPGRRTRNRA